MIAKENAIAPESYSSTVQEQPLSSLSYTPSFTISRVQSKLINFFFFYDTGLFCNVDVTQRDISFPKTFDIQFPAELSSLAAWNCPNCSLYLLKNKLIGSFQISCRVHLSVTIPALARKTFLYSAWDAHITLAAHFYKMQSFFILEIIPCPTCLFGA